MKPYPEDVTLAVFGLVPFRCALVLYVRAIACLVLLMLLLASVASAQTQGTQLLWNYDGIQAATANAWTHTVTVDGQPVTATPSCTGNAQGSICAVAVPQHTSGARTYVVSAISNGVEKRSERTIDPAQGPATPGGLRLSVTVIVQVGQ